VVNYTLGGLWTAFKAFIGLVPTPSTLEALRQEDHSYKRGDISWRSPCPGLNALANHGYLPRDGKHIDLDCLAAGFMEGMGLTHTFARSLAAPTIEMLKMGDAKKFDFIDLRKHNAIEHDASLTRRDYRDGDNWSFQQDMMEDVLKDAHGHPITAKSLAFSRLRRKKENQLTGAPPLVGEHERNGTLQCAALLEVLGSNISQEKLIKFLTEERLPDDFVKARDNGHKLTLRSFILNSWKVWWGVNFGKKP